MSIKMYYYKLRISIRLQSEHYRESAGVYDNFLFPVLFSCVSHTMHMIFMVDKSFLNINNIKKDQM